MLSQMTDEPSSQLRPGLVLPVRTKRAGVDGPTVDEARGPGWRRTSRGYYVPASVSDDDVDQRILEASVVVPPGCAITGWAALRWQGGRWFDGLTAAGERRPVPVVVGTRDLRSRAGIHVSAEGLNPAMVRWVDGVRVTDPRYAVSFEMRYAPSQRGAVQVLDLAAYSDLVSCSEQAAFHQQQSGWTGIPQARAATPLAAENSWSPMEPLMRLVWVLDGGFPEPLCNRAVFDAAGRHLATPDLIDPVTGVVGEYDGDLHLPREQRHHDVRRHGRLRDHGLEPVTMLAPDLRDPSAFLAELAAAFDRARRRSSFARTWTLEQPGWWTPTETVEQRRALPSALRARILGYRAG